MIGKGGIVRDKAAHIDAIKRVCASAESVGLAPVALIPSPIEGGDGNREYVACLVCRGDSQYPSYKSRLDIKALCKKEGKI